MEKVGADWDTSSSCLFPVCKKNSLADGELRPPDPMTGTSLDFNMNQVQVAGRGL